MPLRRAIQTYVRQLLASEGSTGQELTQGDVGLFGPDSAAWRVHGDLTSMMVGGVAALLLQMLHPVALAGIWDHSNFREDRLGRLRRTARFIARTTYGSTDEAVGAIDHVRAIHAKVRGFTPDGQPYSADDPRLLTWIHVAEVSCFLRAFILYKDPSFSGADQDRYYAEVATIAERLGALDVPKSRAAVEAYLQDVRPELRVDARTRDIAQALLAQPGQRADAALTANLLSRAAQDLLPNWAARLHGFRAPLGQRYAISAGVHGVGGVLRWAMRDSAEARARRRAAALG